VPHSAPPEGLWGTFFSETPGWTLAVMAVMSGLFAWTFFRKFSLRYVRNAPTIFTTGGILGTFLGISLALFRFNPGDLQHSLPAFLTGMKTAFYVSLLGVLFSLVIKIRFAILGIPKRFAIPGSDPGVELVHHHLTLHGLVSGGATEEERQPLSVHLSALRKESREGLGEIRDGMGEIRETLERYLARMAESNSRALVDALETVVKKFELQLNSSASQSMKDLAEAVKEIVTWQESYRNAMPTITSELVRVAGMLGEIGESQKSFVAQAEEFRVSFERQGELLSRMTEERDRVEKSITAFMTVLESGKGIFPGLQKSLEQFVAGVSGGLSREMQGVLSQMEKTSAAMNEAIEKNRASFELGLERELTLSLSGLGQQLAALSEKFVEDYTPLTERLREVLSIAEKVGR